MLEIRHLEFLYGVLKQVKCEDDEAAVIYAETFKAIGDQLRAAAMTQGLDRPKTRAEKRREGKEDPAGKEAA